MYAFATYDELGVRFILKGAIPAQETLNASTTINPVSYTHLTLKTDVNWPILRYSDVLLMYAEAENYWNNGPTEACLLYTSLCIYG